MLGLGKKKDFTAKIANSGDEFVVPGGMNLLAAALNAGIKFPHNCRVGSCGTCRCYLKEGKVKEEADFAYVLDQQMLKDGMILACQSTLKSDVVVEVDFDQQAINEDYK